MLCLKNILSAFDCFAGNEILSDRDFQDYQSTYIDLYQEYGKRSSSDREDINDDVVFEIELIRQIEININYILMLVEKYHDTNCEDKNILVDIRKAVDSSIHLRSKKELIDEFIKRVNVDTDVDKDWSKFVLEQKEADLSAIIAEKKLKPEEARKYMDDSFRDGTLKTIGTGIDRIMPPMPRFGSVNRTVKKQYIIESLMKFFDKYSGLI